MVTKLCGGNGGTVLSLCILESLQAESETYVDFGGEFAGAVLRERSGW